MEKAIRALEQAKQNYSLEKQKAAGVVIDNEVNLNRQVRRKNVLVAIMDQFEIHAPKKGMVIYKKEWGGAKRKVGSSISPWDLTVATLPDLSIMNSLTYVNEIDISRIAAGQKVRIGIDAFPEKKATGVVTSVANIGEQLPNADAKVFEVEIQVDGNDPILRPSMTTSNTIIIDKLSNQTYLPLEAIFGIDSIPVVWGISYAGRSYAEGKKIGWKDGFNAIWCILKYSRGRYRDYGKQTLRQLEGFGAYAEWIHRKIAPWLDLKSVV